MKKRKKSVRKSWHEKWFLLSWRKVWMIPAAWVVAVVLHNMIYAAAMYFFNVEFEEAFFFIVAVFGIPIYVIVVLIYSLVWLMKKRFR